jgi:hypothetical protein
MRQEMGSPGLLTKGKDGSKGEGGGEQGARQARSGLHQQEVERHQGEGGRRMGSGEAGSARERVGTVLEEADVGHAATEPRDVPRAVHVGCELDEAHDRGTEANRDDQVGSIPTPRQQPGVSRPAQENREPAKADRPDQQLASAMEEVNRPPCARSDPCLGLRIEEKCSRDPAVEVE